MKIIDMEFMGTKIIDEPGKQPALISDLSVVIKENDYPNELQWGCAALQAIILSHYKSGVDIDTREYKKGLVDVFEQMLERGRQIMKERAKQGDSMNVDG